MSVSNYSTALAIVNTCPHSHSFVRSQFARMRLNCHTCESQRDSPMWHFSHAYYYYIIIHSPTGYLVRYHGSSQSIRFRICLFFLVAVLFYGAVARDEIGGRWCDMEHFQFIIFVSTYGTCVEKVLCVSKYSYSVLTPKFSKEAGTGRVLGLQTPTYTYH
jgi:hypothetical protein